MLSITTENKPQPPIQVQDNKTAAVNLLCGNYLKSSFVEATKLWDYEPQALIFKANRISREPRVKIIEAVRAVFPFNGVFPPPSRAFCDLLVSHFPLGQLFEPANKLNVSTFRESQLFFRTVAIHFHDFFELYPKGDADDLIKYFEKEQVYAQSGLNSGYKETFYDLIRALHAEIRDPLGKNQFSDCFFHRVYTLNTAVTAIQEPQLIVASICDIAHVKFDGSRTEQLKKAVSNLGKILIKDSIRLHFRQLSQEAPTDHDDFVTNLRMCCQKSAPFLRRATFSFLSGKIDHGQDCSTILTTYNTKGVNDTAPPACTLLQAFLGYFGYKAEIFIRMDIDPKLSVSFAHAILLVSDPFNGREVVIDPTYKQFLRELIVDFQSEGFGSDFLVLKDGDLEGMIDFLLNLRRKALSEGVRKHPLFKISEDEFRQHFRVIWGVKGSDLVTHNLNENFFFTNEKSEPSSALCVRELLETIGLDRALSVPKMEDRVRTILQEAKNMDSLALLERLATLDDHSMKLFFKTLALDPRPIVANLLPLKTVGYLLAIRELVNPSHKTGTTTLYGCSGSDLSPLLALDTDHLYMIERTPVDGKKLQALLEQQSLNEPDKITARYKEVKTNIGGLLAGQPDPKKDYGDVVANIENYIVVELASLGVDLKTVKVQKAPEFNGISLSFTWKYHGREARTYEVTWVSTHLEEPQAYPPGLKKLLDSGNVDFYFQKAANHIPQNYGKFLPRIAQSIKVGGCLLTSDYDMFGKKHASSLVCKQFTALEETPTIKAYKKLFKGKLSTGWAIESPGRLEDRVIPRMEEYYTFVDIKRKIGASEV